MSDFIIVDSVFCVTKQSYSYYIFCVTYNRNRLGAHNVFVENIFADMYFDGRLGYLTVFRPVCKRPEIKDGGWRAIDFRSIVSKSLVLEQSLLIQPNTVL